MTQRVHPENQHAKPVAVHARLVGVLALTLAVAVAAIAQGAARGKIEFDLPADNAERTLKQFALCSGLEVIFVSEAVANVRTNKVKGEYTPREAIDRMLAGTRLTALQDKGRGALRIVSISTAGGSREETDSSTITQSPAKKKRPNP